MPAQPQSLADAARQAVLQAERDLIIPTLRKVQWNRRKAAPLLGVSYKTLLNKIKEYGIVDSGDAKTDGGGAMTEARWRDFFDTMAKAGVYPQDVDVRRAFTLQFIDKRVGMKP